MTKSGTHDVVEEGYIAAKGRLNAVIALKRDEQAEANAHMRHIQALLRDSVDTERQNRLDELRIKRENSVKLRTLHDELEALNGTLWNQEDKANLKRTLKPD